jgi:hypothetical protein
MLNSGCSILDVRGWSLASGIALRVARCVSRGENQINPQSEIAMTSVICLPSVACKAKEGHLFSSPETKKAMLLLNTAFFKIIKSVFN